MVPLIIAILIGITLCDVLRRQPRQKVSYAVLGAFFGLMFLIGSGEFAFRCCYARTEGRLASNNWAARYWSENNYGYRDADWNPETWAGKQTVLIMGDSIAAGWAIEQPADRFSDTLAVLLGEEYVVLNAALPGLSTMDQLEKLKTFEPLPNPDVVIWQYTLNDIEGAALQVGLGIPAPETPQIVQRSHLADYLYTRDINNVGFNQGYWEWQYNAYEHPSIWGAHEAELNALAMYTAEQNIQLILVIFPNMADPVGSIPYTDRVEQVFTDYPHVEVLKLFDAAAEWGIDAATVSPRDSHPNADFHRFVGEQLYQRYFGGGASGTNVRTFAPFAHLQCLMPLPCLF